MRRLFSLVVFVLVVGSVTATAQAAHTISPGMTRAQVVAALGQPLKVSEADGFTYIFYKNECTRACGMNDLVTLRADSVVDAIFRSTGRHYTGKSSSPEMIPARVAAHSKSAPPKPLVVKEAPARKPTMKPAPANDTKPSIPVNPPKLQPAPTKKP